MGLKRQPSQFKNSDGTVNLSKDMLQPVTELQVQHDEYGVQEQKRNKSSIMQLTKNKLSVFSDKALGQCFNAISNIFDNDIIRGTAFLLVSFVIAWGINNLLMNTDFIELRDNFFNHVSEIFTGVHVQDIQANTLVTVDNKYTQQIIKDGGTVNKYYFELLAENNDGTTTTYNTSVPYSVYKQFQIGSKFLYDENGQMQPYNN